MKAYTAGVSLLLSLAALAACSQKRKPHASEETATVESAQPKDGVSEDKIVLGSSSALTGSNAQLGVEYWRGAQAYFAETNAAGGVNGRSIDVIPTDDAYDPARQAENVKKLADEQKVFAIFNTTSSAGIAAVIPELEKRKDTGLFEFANLTGTQKQRELPGSAQVYNVRASYAQEAKELVEFLIAAGKSKIGVFVQDDAFGQGGLDGIKKQLATHSLTVIAETRYERTMKYDASAAEQVAKLKAAGVDAIISWANYQPGAALVRDARLSGWQVPIANASPAGDTFLRTLNQLEAKEGKKVETRLVNSQVVPPFDDLSIPAVAEYHALMDKRNPQLPAMLQDANYRTLPYSANALEGFLNAKVLVEVLRRAGRELTRASFINATNLIKGWDPGLGVEVDFSGNDRQAFDKVWLVGIRDGKFVPATSAKTYFEAPPATAAKAGSAPSPASNVVAVGAAGAGPGGVKAKPAH